MDGGDAGGKVQDATVLTPTSTFQASSDPESPTTNLDADLYKLLSDNLKKNEFIDGLGNIYMLGEDDTWEVDEFGIVRVDLHAQGSSGAFGTVRVGMAQPRRSGTLFSDLAWNEYISDFSWNGTSGGVLPMVGKQKVDEFGRVLDDNGRIVGVAQPRQRIEQEEGDLPGKNCWIRKLLRHVHVHGTFRRMNVGRTKVERINVGKVHIYTV